jgi:hypothetical protein
MKEYGSATSGKLIVGAAGDPATKALRAAIPTSSNRSRRSDGQETGPISVSVL